VADEPSFREVIFVDSSHYEGEWQNGKFHGVGTFTYADGSRYEGQWSCGQKHGYGKNTYAKDGATSQYSWTAGDSYVGEWKLNMRHGNAVYSWRSGLQLACVWSEGKCEEWHAMNQKVASVHAAIQASPPLRYNNASVQPYMTFLSDASLAFASASSRPIALRNTPDAVPVSLSSPLARLPALSQPLAASPIAPPYHAPSPISSPSRDQSSSPLSSRRAQCSQFYDDMMSMCVSSSHPADFPIDSSLSGSPTCIIGRLHSLCRRLHC
jgi:hypothetical protein